VNTDLVQGLSVERCQSISLFNTSTFDALLLVTRKTIRATPIIPSRHKQQRRAATPTEIPTIMGIEAPDDSGELVVWTTGVVVFVVFPVGVGVGVGTGGVYE